MSDKENQRDVFDTWLVDVKMPKIKLDTRMNLDKILYSMGIKKAFNEKESDFSTCSPKNWNFTLESTRL